MSAGPSDSAPAKTAFASWREVLHEIRQERQVEADEADEPEERRRVQRRLPVGVCDSDTTESDATDEVEERRNGGSAVRALERQIAARELAWTGRAEEASTSDYCIHGRGKGSSLGSRAYSARPGTALG